MLTETPLFELPALTNANGFHAGGGIHFGTDGKLYVAVGNDVNNVNSQSMDTLLGKVIRINADGTIPEDNPFYESATGDNRAIYALGFRNPFSFAVSPSGVIHVNDVGETSFEEINLLAPGANYGWPVCEGPCGPPNLSYTDPLYWYGRVDGRAITAGVFYDGADLPLDHQGDYFFADYLGRWIKRLNSGTPLAIETGGDQTIALDVGPDGFLYSLALNNGRIYRHSLR
jgi:glucose/arabinose dehydrogenase